MNDVGRRSPQMWGFRDEIYEDLGIGTAKIAVRSRYERSDIGTYSQLLSRRVRLVPGCQEERNERFKQLAGLLVSLDSIRTRINGNDQCSTLAIRRPKVTHDNAADSDGERAPDGEPADAD